MKTLKELTLEIVIERAKHFKWNRLDTAESLGIAVRTVSNYVNEYKRQNNLLDTQDLYRCEECPSNEERLKFLDYKLNGKRD
jgi:predicted transcriptional regulator